ncbi:MAG: CpaF family protein [Endozoicomonas sp.]
MGFTFISKDEARSRTESLQDSLQQNHQELEGSPKAREPLFTKKTSDVVESVGAAGAGNLTGQRRDSGTDHSQPELPETWRLRILNAILERLELTRLVRLERAVAEEEISTLCQALYIEFNAPLTAEQRLAMQRLLIDEILGLGPLERILNDPEVSDILVNRADTIFVERNGRLSRHPARFRDDEHLMAIIDRIVARVGRRIDESSPLVDARLPDGSRVNAIIPPLALDGPSLSIRRTTVDRMNLDRLAEMKAMAPQMAKALKAMVQMRLNILISGGTGSGKTTMLNALSGCIGADERIITIEDSAELQLQQPHVVRLESRPANLEGRGEITLRELMRNSLRMRPDRIVVGEVRGAEALDMLTAMNTGHDGSLSTLHANNPRDCLSRVENMVAMSGIQFAARSLREQIVSAIDIVVQLERQEDGGRRVVSIQEVNGVKGDVITMTELFTFQRQGHGDQGRVLGSFQANGLAPSFLEKMQLQGIALDSSVFSSDWQYPNH